MSQHPRTDRPARRLPSYDAVVVGAHPAGAATAMLLARRGWSTLLVHRNGLSDDRFVTSPMQRGAALLLARWGLLDAVLAAGTAPVRRTVFRYGDDEEVFSVQPSHGVDVLCAPSRAVLEPLLVRRAVDAGVDVRLGTTVTDLLWRGGRVAGVRIAAPAGRSRCRRRAGWSSAPTAPARASPNESAPRRRGSAGMPAR